MQIQLTGHRLEITDALRSFTTEKLSRLQRHFEHIISVSVTFDIENLTHIAEATVHLPAINGHSKGNDLHARSESEDDMYSAVDLLIDKLDRQLIKHKEKSTNHRGKGDINNIDNIGEDE